jgi:hypothetical protein
VTSQNDPDRALDALLRQMSADRPSSSDCPDFEQFAAWSDGALEISERRRVEHHLSTCGRCQQVLAAFTATAPAVPAASPLWRRPFVRWLIPITAAAAAAMVWAVRPDDGGTTTFAPTSTTARLEPQSDAERPAAEPRQPPPEARQDANERENRAPAAAPPDVTDRAEAPADVSRNLHSARPAEPPSKAETEALRQRTAEAPASAAAAAPARPAAARTAPPSPPPTLADSAAAAGPRAEAAFSPEMAANAGPVVMATPDPARQWRLRGGGLERTDDGGATWQAIALPAGAAPTAGACPSRNVCWLIGPSGLVLRTTDGASFSAVNIPGAGALVSVRAEGASRATITAADGRTFATVDGGTTWK